MKLNEIPPIHHGNIPTTCHVCGFQSLDRSWFNVPAMFTHLWCTRCETRLHMTGHPRGESLDYYEDPAFTKEYEKWEKNLYSVVNKGITEEKK